MVTLDGLRDASEPAAHVIVRIPAEERIGSVVQERLIAVCRELESDPHGKVLVLRLGGPSRTNLTSPYPPGVTVREVNRWEKTLRRVECLSTPIVSVLEGDCTGLAFEISLVSDVRIATADLKVGVVTIDQAGIPGITAMRLARQLGVAQARRFVLLGATADAARALSLGLLDSVSDHVEDDLEQVLRRLGHVDGAGWAVWRRLLIDDAGKEFDDLLGPSLAACARSLRRRRAENPST